MRRPLFEKIGSDCSGRSARQRRAGRLPIVREAVGEAAYAAGEFALALSEFRAVRRMTGSDAYLDEEEQAEPREVEPPQGRHDDARASPVEGDGVALDVDDFL